MRLENWYKSLATENEFVIWGNVYEDEHDRFPNGTWMHTSGILNCEVKEGDIVQTRNNKYTLGVPYAY